MKIVAPYVHPNEGCWGLFEGSRRGRWVQAVYVVRGDAIAEYLVDLGAEEDFDGITPILIPGFGDDTVDAIQYLAEKNRHDHHWHDRSKELLAESTLVEDHLRQLEQDRELIRNRSVLGPAVSVQRNDYSRARTERLLKEQTNGHR